MNEDSSINPPAVPDQSGTDVVSLLKRMQQHLLFLEKKIDLLLSQSQERPLGEKAPPDRVFRKKPFSKPFRSFNHTQRHGKGEHGHSSRERDSAPGPYHERRQRDKTSRSRSRKETVLFQAKRPGVGNKQNRYLQRYLHQGEIVWLFKIEDTTEVREKCIRPFVRIAKRNAKSLSNPGKIVRCIAGTVSPNTKIVVVKNGEHNLLPGWELV